MNDEDYDESDPEGYVADDQDDEFHAILKSRLQESGLDLEAPSPICSLLKLFGKKQHASLYRISANYSFSEYREKSQLFLADKPAFYALSRKVAVLTKVAEPTAENRTSAFRNPTDDHAESIRDLSSFLKISSNFTQENIIKYLSVVRKHLWAIKSKTDQHHVVKESIKLKLPELKIASTTFFRLISSVSVAIECSIQRHPSFNQLNSSDKATVLLLALLSEYLSEADFSSLCGASEAEKKPHFLDLAEDLLAIAFEQEMHIASNSNDHENYAYTFNGSATQPMFASKFAIAALLYSYDKSIAVADVISLVFCTSDQESLRDHLKDSIHRCGDGKFATLNAALIRNFFNGISPEQQRFKFRNEYVVSDDWRGSLGNSISTLKVSTDLRQRGYLKYLQAVFCTLTENDIFKNTTWLALASKLIVWNCTVTYAGHLPRARSAADSCEVFEGYSVFNQGTEKPKVAHRTQTKQNRLREPACYTPTHLSAGQRTYAASWLTQSVFEKYVDELVKFGRGHPSPPILEMVHSIYFSSNGQETPNSGFDWENRRKKFSPQEVCSNDHVPKISVGGYWGDCHLWLYGRHFAAAIESALKLHTEKLGELVRGSKPHLPNRATTESSSKQALNETYMNQQTFAMQAERLARFIFLIPETHSPANPSAGSVNHNLQDKSLVQGSLKAVSLALARRVARHNPHLRQLYEPIYNAHVKIDARNPFFGQAGSHP